LKLGVLGCMGFSGNILLCMYAVHLSNADTVGIFSSTMPIFCTIMALILRKEATTVLKIVGTAISFCGAAMQFIKTTTVVGTRSMTPSPFAIDFLLDEPASEYSLLLSDPSYLGATNAEDDHTQKMWYVAAGMLLFNYFCLGLFVVLLKDFTKKYYNFYTMHRALGFGCIPILIAAAVQHKYFAYLWSGQITWQMWCAVAYTGCILSVFPFTLMGWALRRASPVLVGVYINLQPIVTAALSFFFLGERLGLFQALGAVVIIIGVLFVTFGKSVAEKEQMVKDMAERRAELIAEKEEAEASRYERVRLQ